MGVRESSEVPGKQRGHFLCQHRRLPGQGHLQPGHAHTSRPEVVQVMYTSGEQ